MTRALDRAAAAEGVVLGHGAPGWVLRLAVALTGALVVGIPATGGAKWGALLILGPAVLVSVYAPASPVPAGVVIGAAVLCALTGDDPLRPAVLAMIPAVHLFHLACSFAGVVPARGRIHPRAFLRPAVRFVVVQVIVFALVGVAALLPVTRIPAWLEVVSLVGLVAIALTILAWHRQRRDDSHTRSGGH
jgi:hypothetical protein